MASARHHLPIHQMREAHLHRGAKVQGAMARAAPTNVARVVVAAVARMLDI